MTENTATPITQAQVDFVKKTMSERGLDVSTIPNPNEGETVEEWFNRSIAQYNEVARNNDLGEHTYLYSGINYVAYSANQSASFLSTMKPFVVNDFASMSDAEQVNFLKQQIDENIKPTEHGVYTWWSLSGQNLDEATDRFMQQMRDESVKYSDFSYDFNTGNWWDDLSLSARAESKVSLYKGAGVPAEETLQITGLDLVDDDKYNDRMKTQLLCMRSCDIAMASINFPKYEERVVEEPVVEKPLGMATTSKDHRDRIDQWMKYLGKADQAQALVDKYGVEVAYKICQQSMLAPADLKDVTGGTSLSSKDAVQYFLDAEITPKFLESETGAKAFAEALGMDTAVVQESVWSANRELFLEPTLETEEIEIPVETVALGEERAEEVVKAVTPILEGTGVLDVLENVELDTDGSLNRDSLRAELASMTPSEGTIDPTVYLNDKKFERELARDKRRAERKGMSVEDYREDKAEKQAARKAKREAFAAEVREFWGL